jgi:triacylglycerol lipase
MKLQKPQAVLYATVARATYLNQCNDSNFQLTARFENKGTDTQGIFGEAFGNSFVIGFRGSEETGAADWITDLKFVLVAYPFAPGKDAAIKVHLGFVDAYSSVRDAILNGAKNSKHSHIITTGHSLGGALATLAAMDIKLNVPGRQVSCYTFGSPKVGNPAFAAAYNKLVPDTHRFVNDADVVPTIPPLGYEHVGELHHLGANVVDTSGIIEMLTEKVADHLPNNYLAALQKYL